jgi:peptide/nickel transport system permease protein
MAAMLADAGAPAAADAALRDQASALNDSLPAQYARWFGRVLQGDFGESIYGSRAPVRQIIVEAMPRTLSLALLSFVIALIIAVPAGLVSALWRGGAADHTVTVAAFLGLSMPDFWLAIILIIIFAANLQWLPAIGYAPMSEGVWEWLSHLILPAIAAGTAFSAVIARMIRSAMLEVLGTDYLRTAEAKGLSPLRIVFVHALPNAMIPVITVMGIAFGLLMAGAVVVENVFAIKGLGRVLIESILNRDYPVVQGAILAISLIFVVANLVVDLAYGLIDPRIRYD